MSQRAVPGRLQDRNDFLLKRKADVGTNNHTVRGVLGGLSTQSEQTLQPVEPTLGRMDVIGWSLAV